MNPPKSDSKAEAERSSSNQTPCLAQRETREINVLRVFVALLLVSIATASGICVLRYARRVQTDAFETDYRANAQAIIHAFHDSIERKLGGINGLSSAITSFALATNNSFPFVTMPDFELRGCDTRIQADAFVIHWLPLVTDENRDEWEAYALRERGHIDVAYEEDRKRRIVQDELYGLQEIEVDGSGRQLEEYELISATDNDHDDRNGNHHARLAGGAVFNRTTTPVLLHPRQEQQEETTAAATSSERELQNGGFPGTISDDGSGFHERIWSHGAVTPLGDEANGTGPFLPMWQRSPINANKQKDLNLNVANFRILPRPVFNAILETQQAIMSPAAIPIPKTREAMRMNLAVGQYRHDIDEYLDDPGTFFIYPVFDSFDVIERQVGGVLLTNVYWRLFFENILPDDAIGYICVLENSYNQTLTYQIDGHSVTYLGQGDLHDVHYDRLEESADINRFVRSQASPRTRSYTTVPLNQDLGKYRLRIYPTDDTKDMFLTNRPIIYTVVVLSVFVFTTIVLVCLDRVVARRQRKMMARIVGAAEETAVAERQMNEFLAHEVRNPIAAALSAYGFVTSALNSTAGGFAVLDDNNKKSKSESPATLLEDVQIIGSSLYFVDEFLRSILDLYRAKSNRIQIHLGLTDLLKDVLEPVCSILYQRGGIIDVSVDCPDNLFLSTDTLRLKQVMMNLGRNSIKFTQRGFVRFGASVVDGLVELYVCDSGSGIPAAKRGDMLFEKFQTSLDSLSQGTGVGLALCKHLVELLHGDIYLDETYNSGLEGFPGAKFVIKLNTPPSPTPMFEHSSCFNKEDTQSTEVLCHPPEEEGTLSRLFENISVLFVDDDSMLRRLFSRSIKKVAPSWKIMEAANGESALRLVDEGEVFDLIFLDQYMASTEKQLLGSETARCLREKGVSSIICGLSANDLESVFLEAGADCFQLKPFPCKRHEMEKVLINILGSGEQQQESVFRLGGDKDDAKDDVS